MSGSQRDNDAKSQGSHEGSGSTAPTVADGDALDTHSPRRVAYCSTCRGERTSSARSTNHCGTCGTFLRGHIASTKMPPDNHRCRQLADSMFLRYDPQDEIARAFCVQAAVTFERYEKETDPNRRKSRFADYKELVSDLEATRASRQRGEDFPGADSMPVADLELAQDLLRRLGDGAELTEFERGQLSVLYHAASGRITLPAGRDDRSPEGCSSPAPSDSAVPTPDAPAGPEPEAGQTGAETGPEPEARCEFCHQTLSRCAEIRETRLEDWRALHWRDPEEVKCRDDEGTAEMFESIRRARRGEIPRW